MATVRLDIDFSIRCLAGNLENLFFWYEPNFSTNDIAPLSENTRSEIDLLSSFHIRSNRIRRR